MHTLEILTYPESQAKVPPHYEATVKSALHAAVLVCAQKVGQAKQTLAAVGPPKQKVALQVSGLVASHVATLVPHNVQVVVP